MEKNGVTFKKFFCIYCGRENRILDNRILEIYSQRDPRWSGVPLGFSKKTTIGSHGCFVTCFAMMVRKEPHIVNQILKEANAFGGPDRDLIISERAAKALGMEYFGKETNIDNVPNMEISIKEVDMSPAPGKQQHFVIRIAGDKDKKVIIDPWTGKIEPIGFYPFVSYRLFKYSV